MADAVGQQYCPRLSGCDYRDAEQKGAHVRSPDVHFAGPFYMHLVSGECRLALVLYRLYLAWLKRCSGAAAKVPVPQNASDQLNPH